MPEQSTSFWHRTQSPIWVPAHTPAVHTSPSVQGLPSSQVVPSGRFSTTQKPPAPQIALWHRSTGTLSQSGSPWHRTQPSVSVPAQTPAAHTSFVGHVLDAAEAVGAGRPLALVVWGRALARVLALVAPAGGGVEGFSWGAILDAGVVAGAQRLAGCTSADLAAALGVLDAIT